MSLTPDEEALFQHAKASLPKWLFQRAGGHFESLVAGLAKTIGQAMAQLGEWATQTYLLQATGEWLKQHARDRGTCAREGESEAALRERLRNVQEAVTESALLAACNAILDGAGISGTAALVPLRMGRAFCGDFTGNGTPDSITAPVATVQTMTDAGAHFRAFLVGRRVTIAGATQAGNNGTFPVTAVPSPTTIQYTNAGGAAESPATGTWTLVAACKAFLSRGYRMGKSGLPNELIVILPYGTTAAVEAAVDRKLEELKAGGYKHSVEVRAVP